jgi:hypothetical protein
MKTLLSVLAATAKGIGLGGGGSPTRVVGYTSCGTPIVAVYRVVGYDRCGNPIGQWVTLPPQVPSRGYSSGYGRPGCAPSQGFYSRPRSGISFSFGFGR